MAKALYVFLIYIYIYNPFFFFWGGYSSHIILLPLLLLLFNRNIIKDYYNQKDLINTYILLLLFVFFRSLLGGDILLIKIFLSQFISNILYAIVLIGLARKYNFDLKNTILLVGVLSVIITVICLVVPPIGTYVKTSLIRFGDEYTQNHLEVNTYRGFGIASGLTYDYGIILATFYCYCLYLGKSSKWWFFILTPFLLISILVNARTGFIILCVGTIIYLYYNKKKIKYFIGELLILLISVGFLYLQIDENVRFFVEGFFEEMTSLTQGEDSGTFNALMVNMKVLPNNFLDWLFGVGHLVFEKDVDVGFILQLNYGGIIFMLILLYQCTILIKKSHNNFLKFFILALILISNFKGNFFLNSGCYRFVTFLILYENILYSKPVKKVVYESTSNQP